MFLSGKAEIAVKTRQVFSSSPESARTEFLQRFLKPDPKGWFASKPADYRQAQMQTEGYIKSGGEQTAHRRSRKNANLAYSGSTAIPNGLEQPVMKLWFTFCPSKSARPIVSGVTFAQ